MDLEALATHLSDKSRLGLDEPLSAALGIVDADATRGRLLAQQEGVRGHLQVVMLGCFVVDDTDFFGAGEIYWWSVPALVSADGKVHRSALHGLPTGMPPHKCGDMEWMTNISLAHPPVWAVIPPGDDVSACVVRLGIYDDDRDPADLRGALAAGLTALSTAPKEVAGADALITPVRDALFLHLKAADDDILIEQDVTIRKGEISRFGAGIIGSVVNAMARTYYFVRDTTRTQQFGPITLHKGQIEQVCFGAPIEQGGRLAVFARGHDVQCPSLGELSVDMPFMNRVVTARQEEDMKNGLQVMGTGPAKLVAYYTPSYAAEEH
jgi:hypothetical protein